MKQKMVWGGVVLGSPSFSAVYQGSGLREPRGVGLMHQGPTPSVEHSEVTAQSKPSSPCRVQAGSSFHPSLWLLACSNS